MTIQVSASRVQYIADGTQTVFAYGFRVFQDDNLAIYVDGVLQVIVTDYTMTNTGEETGGDVIFVLPPVANTVVSIERMLSNQQLLDLIAFDRFPAESVEAGMDYIVLLIQQNTDALNRTISASAGILDDVDITIPAPGNGEFWRWADDGKSIVTTNITNIAGQIVPVATDAEITTGIETQTRLLSPFQAKLAVQAHETAPIADIANVQWVQVVDVLPASPAPSTLYLVKN